MKKSNKNKYDMLTKNDSIDTSNMTEDQIFWIGLTKKEKDEIENYKWKLIDEGFGTHKDFVVKACYEESVRVFKENKENANQIS